MRRRLKAADISPIFLLVDHQATTPIAPASLFPRPGPIELEIGCGKGLFLLRESLRQPDRHWLGVEWSRKFATWAATRCARAEVDNVRVLCADARRLLPRLPARSLDGVHVYFPDPWWKRRHRKRRIIAPDFLAQVSRILVPGAPLALATDVEEYFAVMNKVVAQFPAFIRVAESPDLTPAMDYLTHFERKYRIQGRSIYRARFRFFPPIEG